MINNKLIKILLFGLIGPAIGLSLFFGLGGMSQIGTTPIVEVVLVISFISYIVVLPFLGIFMYSTKERNLDEAIMFQSNVYLECITVLSAIQQQLHPNGDDTTYSIEDSKLILKSEIIKARSAGASNKELVEYLQSELNNWISGTRYVESDFAEYTTIIDELREEQ